MRRSLLAGVAACAVFAAAPAFAEGWYVAGDLGWHWPESVKVKGAVLAPSTSARIKSDSSWALFGRVGYQFTPNWRLEAEGSYRGADLKSIRASDGTVLTSLDGKTHAWSLGANVIYDFSPDATISPFIGFGAGVGRGKVKFSGTALGVVPYAANDSRTGWGAQALGGLAWRVSDRTHVDLTYRYGIADVKAQVVRGAITGLAGASGAVKGDARDHTLSIGVRYALGAPAPAPAPAAEPPPPPPPPPPVEEPPPPPPPPPAPPARSGERG